MCPEIFKEFKRSSVSMVARKMGVGQSRPGYTVSFAQVQWKCWWPHVTRVMRLSRCQWQQAHFPVYVWWWRRWWCFAVAVPSRSTGRLHGRDCRWRHKVGLMRLSVSAHGCHSDSQVPILASVWVFLCPCVCMSVCLSFDYFTSFVCLFCVWLANKCRWSSELC